MKQYILFDNDGILVDTEQYYFQSSKEVLEEVGLHLTLPLFREISLIKGEGVWNAFEELKDNEKLVDTLRKKRDLIYNEYLKTQPILIDGVEEKLIELSKDFRMAIVTSSLRENFLTIHNRTGLLKFFEFYITNEDYERSKPFPDPYLLALEKFNISSDQAVVIEDTERGIEAATAANIDSIAIPTELSKESNFTNAALILDSIKELNREKIFSL